MRHRRVRRDNPYDISKERLSKNRGKVMRKAQKELAKNLIKLLEQTHDQIRNDIEKQDVQDALMLLADCQEKAIELGTMIEKSEGDGRKAVSMLEEYCEMAYQIYDKLSNGEEVGANKAYKTLRQQIVRVSNSVANDIVVRKEVVFIPYKASMWDSLESVWRAADVDAECDAYVVPIPYYDKNPDGSLKEWHYEIDEYPKDVPVVDYREYDFEGRHPDVIYFHNPYDNYNLVTSVEPFFYTENLRKYADKLVYIPYFVLDEISPDDDAAIRGMAHFCTTPGVVNADEVIVQSEDMKKVYVKVLSEKYGEESRKVWEEKILGLGSPKLDKVANTRKEELEIPREWRRIIEKPDGSWKKIVFYNTSIAALLEHNEKMLEKMKDVFRIFEENKDEVALLWRPHPLIKSTVEAMRPKLWEEYEKIVEEYKAEGWGIYDDTADVDRAVVISDAYYGDGSSVVQMYKRTGKPIMVQNVDVV